MFWILAAAFGAAGLWLVFCCPDGCKPRRGYRIIFVYVRRPGCQCLSTSSWPPGPHLALDLNARLSSMMAQALAPTGALMALLSLWTGALWGKPMWGTWWVWDARLTSELILLFLYLGFMALQASIDDPRRADKAGAVLALVGVVNVPIIYFSGQMVEHPAPRGASVAINKSPSMAATMLWGMLLMALCFWMYAIAVALMRVRAIM